MIRRRRRDSGHADCDRQGGWGPHPGLSRSRWRPNANLSSRHGRRLRHAESALTTAALVECMRRRPAYQYTSATRRHPTDRGHVHSGTAPVARRRRATEPHRIRASSRLRSSLLRLQPHARAPSAMSIGRRRRRHRTRPRTAQLVAARPFVKAEMFQLHLKFQRINVVVDL